MRTKRDRLPWAEVGGRAQAPGRPELQLDFELALVETKLPERPDYAWANEFLLKTEDKMARSVRSGYEKFLQT
jgi:hypothetical protein